MRSVTVSISSDMSRRSSRSMGVMNSRMSFSIMSCFLMSAPCSISCMRARLAGSSLGLKSVRISLSSRAASRACATCSSIIWK